MPDKLALTDIEVDPGINPRADGLDPETVEEYAAALAGGVDFPPSVVYRNPATGSYLLSEGFHRYAAHVKAGRSNMACEVREGDRRDALLNAVASNQRHGLRRTNADKRKAVELALTDCPDWSNRRVAEHVGVGDQLVADVRADLVSRCVIHAPDARQGKDQKTYSAKPKKKQPEPVNQDTPAEVGKVEGDTPGSSAGEGAGEERPPLPEPVHPADELIERVNKLCRKLDECKAEAADLAKDPFGGFIHYESVEHQITSARKALWQARPTEVCEPGTGINGTDRTCAARVLRRGAR